MINIYLLYPLLSSFIVFSVSNKGEYIRSTGTECSDVGQCLSVIVVMVTHRLAPVWDGCI